MLSDKVRRLIIVLILLFKLLYIFCWNCFDFFAFLKLFVSNLHSDGDGDELINFLQTAFEKRHFPVQR